MIEFKILCKKCIRLSFFLFILKTFHFETLSKSTIRCIP